MCCTEGKVSVCELFDEGRREVLPIAYRHKILGGRLKLKTHQRQTNVKLKRNSSHLSVREMAWFILPLPFVVGVCSEMLTDLESSILTKFARPRTYLIRMATMQAPPTSQPRNTEACVSKGTCWEDLSLYSAGLTGSTADDYGSVQTAIKERRKGKDDRE